MGTHLQERITPQDCTKVCVSCRFELCSCGWVNPDSRYALGSVHLCDKCHRARTKNMLPQTARRPWWRRMAKDVRAERRRRIRKEAAYLRWKADHPGCIADVPPPAAVSSEDAVRILARNVEQRRPHSA